MIINQIFIIASSIIVVLAIILNALYGKTSSARARRFHDRTELCPNVFYQQYFESSGLAKDQVIEILNNIAYQLEVPAGLLHPTDRFSKELKTDPFNEWDDGIGFLGLELDNLIQKEVSKIKPSDINNIDDYIRFIIAINQVKSK